MSQGTRLLLTSDKALPYKVAGADHREIQLTHSLAGFRVPALPLAREGVVSSESYALQVLHRFATFVRALHDPNRRAAIGLHVMAHPERSRLGSEVGVYLLCRVAAENYIKALEEAESLAIQVQQLFPTESLFNYGSPIRLTANDLGLVTGQKIPDTQLTIVDLRKYEDYLSPAFPDGRHEYIPHPFWADTRSDPWLTLIEILADQRRSTLISIVLEPTFLVEEEDVATLAQKFGTIVEKGTQRAERLAQMAQALPREPGDRTVLEAMQRAEAMSAQGLTDYLVTRARRGAYVYGQLLAWQDQLFDMRVSLAAQGAVPEALIQAVRVALSSPSGGTSDADLGWVRPEVVQTASEHDKTAALHSLHWLGHLDWSDSSAGPRLRCLRHTVTAQEAVGLFHLPVMPQAGQTTALSTADVPFVIPPEVVSIGRLTPEDGPLVSFGYLYQRALCLSPDPEQVGKNRVLDLKLRLSDLEKPSLLVGAPGSGKTNLAIHLLIQLWKEHQVPFLVLDPSTGHEYRYLYAEPALQDDLLVYTLGDEEGLPFRFNPFEVPPGVTARGHITRLLGCFKAAYEMWDPLPAIYEAALARVYSRPPYEWPLAEKGGNRPSPCLADFARAVEDELNENVLPDYGKGTEASGILTGASKIRVNSILNNQGHILNVRNSDTSFFKLLLTRPAVIEMGALGDPSAIALIMAFLITQLAGHIEYAYRQGARKEKPHLLLIEEAHRLLSAETVATAGPNQGNVRGKSAEEMNNLLAEVRKFRQGIMVLDQRPSSLVGGVLDNAKINIMCRLNDRIGFEHLSNVLNLSLAQQRYARTRLQPGDAIMLDDASGQPVLTRAPKVLDKLRKARLSANLSMEEERREMHKNADQAGLLPPPADPIPEVRYRNQGHGTVVEEIWQPVEEHLDADLVESVRQHIDADNWPAVRRAIRSWLTVHKDVAGPAQEATVFTQIASRLQGRNATDLLAIFQERR